MKKDFAEIIKEGGFGEENIAQTYTHCLDSKQL